MLLFISLICVAFNITTFLYVMLCYSVYWYMCSCLCYLLWVWGSLFTLLKSSFFSKIWLALISLKITLNNCSNKNVRSVGIVGFIITINFLKCNGLFFDSYFYRVLIWQCNQTVGCMVKSWLSRLVENHGLYSPDNPEFGESKIWV